MIDFERTSSFVLSKHRKSKKHYENPSRNKDFRAILKNAGPKGSPGFERVLPGYFFPKNGFCRAACFFANFNARDFK